MTKQVTKHVGPFGDIEIREIDTTKHKRHASRSRNDSVKVQGFERRERERLERYEREAVEAERNEREIEIEKWERTKLKNSDSVTRYKPRRPPPGYKDPHEVIKQALPRKMKEEKRQEIKALMNCIAFTPSQVDLTAASEEEQERRKTAEEIDNSLSSDTTSDITEVTPRSSSSGCSSMSKQSLCMDKTEQVKVVSENKNLEDKLKRGNEMNLKKSNTKNMEEDKQKDNQNVEPENGKKMSEVELEEMKYLQDAFEVLDVDEETSDFASSIISGLSEERRAKSNRKNMTFTNEQLREIERVNLILLKKIMNHRKPKAKPQIQPVNNRRTSAAINRARMEEKIERENKLTLRQPTMLEQAWDLRVTSLGDTNDFRKMFNEQVFY